MVSLIIVVLAFKNRNKEHILTACTQSLTFFFIFLKKLLQFHSGTYFCPNSHLSLPMLFRRTSTAPWFGQTQCGPGLRHAWPKKASMGLVTPNWFQNLFSQQVFEDFLLVLVTVTGFKVILRGQEWGRSRKIYL
jgi:hypothetical protein